MKFLWTKVFPVNKIDLNHRPKRYKSEDDILTYFENYFKNKNNEDHKPRTIDEHESIIRKLMNQGADLNYKDGYEDTPLLEVN